MIHLFLLARCIALKEKAFHFQVLVNQWIHALSISWLEKHRCLPCPGKRFGTTWEFSYKHTEQQYAWEKNKFIIAVRNNRIVQAVLEIIYILKPRSFKTRSSDKVLFNCIFYCIFFIWYNLICGGGIICLLNATISDIRTLNHINKIMLIGHIIKDTFIDLSTSASCD